MDSKIKETAEFLRNLIRQDQLPSRLDLTSVPKSLEREYRNAFAEVCKEMGVQCPELNFVSADDQSRMNKKIDDIIAGISDEAKRGKDIQIRLDFEGFEEFVTSLPPMLINRMWEKLGYTLADDSSKRIHDENGRKVAVMRFKPV